MMFSPNFFTLWVGIHSVFRKCQPQHVKVGILNWASDYTSKGTETVLGRQGVLEQERRSKKRKGMGLLMTVQSQLHPFLLVGPVP